MSKKNKKSKKTEKRQKLKAKSENLFFEEDTKKKTKVKKPVEAMVEEKNEIPFIEQPKTSGPRLELILGSISKDSQIEVKMDWNQEFLNQIRSRGFNAHNEEEAILSFLNWMFIVRLSDTPDAAIEQSISPELKEALKNCASTGEVIT